ncbi:MAG TPA: DUF58 domain-containing protein [Acidimicrobiia bacterium]|nr:DUF58 domain-containing protein [Acidimicrobiia bacterium]
MLLDPRLRARLERLSLGVRGRVTAQWAGRHASTRLGESLDFADYRPYQPGDDYRRIDHNLRARLGVVMVRQFEAEQELPIDVVMDVSASMGMYGKLDSARRLAALVAYMGLASGDRVRLWASPGENGRADVAGPSGRHLSAWPQLEAWLEGVQIQAEGSLRSVGRRLAGSGGSVVLVSDLLTEDWADVLDGLVATPGGLVLHLLAPEEMDPRLAGDLELVDVESGARVPVSTDEEVLAGYRRAVDEFALGASRHARRSGLDYLLVESGTGAEERALEALARREVVR